MADSTRILRQRERHRILKRSLGTGLMIVGYFCATILLLILLLSAPATASSMPLIAAMLAAAGMGTLGLRLVLRTPPDKDRDTLDRVEGKAMAECRRSLSPVPF